MLNRQNNRPRSFPLCWIAMLFGFLLSCASTAAAEVVGEWRSFGGVALGCDGPVRDMAASPDGTVYLGGSFGLCGNVVVNNVVAFDPVSGEFSALGIEEANGVDGEVHAVLVHDGSLYVTGVFARAGAVAQAGGIARWDGDVWTRTLR